MEFFFFWKGGYKMHRFRERCKELYGMSCILFCLSTNGLKKKQAFSLRRLTGHFFFMNDEINTMKENL